MTESWAPIVDFEGFYSISTLGRVRSEARTIPWNGTTRNVKPRILKLHKDPEGYLRVTLSREGNLYSKLIHVLLLESFVSERPARMRGLHWDDNRLNNDLSNLYWGTPAQNGQDAVRNGRNPLANRTECNSGHEYTPENTYTYPSRNKRVCRTCQRNRMRDYRKRAA
jgi:hypothetical protein